MGVWNLDTRLQGDWGLRVCGLVCLRTQRFWFSTGGMDKVWIKIVSFGVLQDHRLQGGGVGRGMGWGGSRLNRLQT